VTPTREIYGNIVGGEVVYLFMLASFGVLGWALYRHVQRWMRGRPKIVLTISVGASKTCLSKASGRAKPCVKVPLACSIS